MFMEIIVIYYQKNRHTDTHCVEKYRYLKADLFVG